LAVGGVSLVHSATGQETRVQGLNDAPPRAGKYVLYWMQQSQRAEFNHALEYAVQRANDLKQPLLAAFGLMDGYPEANLRHYRFMLEGLRETRQALARRGIRLLVQHGDPDAVALRLGRDASLIVCDRGYLRHQKQWRQRVADEFAGEVVQVESDVIVPVEVASNRAEFAARTLRPKLHRHLPAYLVELRATRLRLDSIELRLAAPELDLTDLDATLSRLKLNREVPPVSLFRGGTSKAKKHLRDFIRRQLPDYGANRNQPQTDHVSHMSKYLHFGQISPVYVALQLATAKNSLKAEYDKFLDELLVRRELAQNFVHYTVDYDRFSCIPGWAQATLRAHALDPRPYQYTRSQLEAAETHDPYWNAAMREMRYTGYMHNYMRMYWGKKILEWGRTPEDAFATALAINNKYFIDGRDANSYANVAWVFGLHDRPWPERAVYGKVRSMAASGLERKADMPAYIRKVEGLISDLDEASGHAD
jgi:deoxyribodipyrimidine photo-lyase